MGLDIKGYFTIEKGKILDPYSKINWKEFIAEIKDTDDKIVFRQEGVIAPDFWSQTAVNIVANKFFYGELNSKNRESHVRSMINRVVNQISFWGVKHDYFTNEDSQLMFENELKYMLIYQMFSFNSPVWFNVGNPYSKDQVSACFINSLEDTMESIGALEDVERKIFRSGSGAGCNSSPLRSSKESITGGGLSSGPVSFMKPRDATAGVWKSGGKTRRAAKIEILNIDHGDIVEFIQAKGKEERKAKALIKAGWSANFDDPQGAYSSIFFQNSNFSTRIFDNFMEAVEKGEDWALIERYASSDIQNRDTPHTYKVTSQGNFTKQNDIYYMEFYEDFGGDDARHKKVIEWIPAKDLFRTIAREAWETGDPGIQFHDTINAWHTCPQDGEINASNPCSEYMFLDDTSCNLASLNLIKFLYDNTGDFNIVGFKAAIGIAITAMDIMISEAYFPSKEIKKQTLNYRTLGLGYANLGALLMKKQMPYDSSEGREYAASITALLLSTAYAWSVELSVSAGGAFPEWDVNRNSMKDVIEKHKSIMVELDNRIIDIERSGIMSAALDEMQKCTNYKFYQGNFVPFRNAQVTVMAPTGTISFMMDCDTTGMEPMMGLIQIKSLVGGGTIKIVSKVVAETLSSMDYSDKAIEGVKITGSVKGTPTIWNNPKEKAIFATALGDNTISPSGHLKMMAAIQPFLSGAISKTVNLPNDTTVDQIEKIYMQAWKMGIKSIAVYRDGCKDDQPVNVNIIDDTDNIEKASEVSGKSLMDPKEKRIYNLLHPFRKPLNVDRDGKIHRFEIAGHRGYLTVGLYEDGTPGEIFLASIGKEGQSFGALADGWATLFSISLQYGVPLKFLIDKFKDTKFEPSGITLNDNIRFTSSIFDYVCRYLEREFLNPEATISDKERPNELNESVLSTAPIGALCNNCGGMLQRAGTCLTCTICGSTTGCS